MKKIRLLLAICTVMIGIPGCTRESSCESCLSGNKPPVANAGADQVISLPKDYVNLDGSGSADPDGNILGYQWKKLSGPASFNIDDISLVRPQVTGLVAGVYQIELTVTDSLGLVDKDTMQIIVNQLSGQQDLHQVIFYWADPTGTVKFDKDENSVPYPWLEWDSGGVYLNLVTIKLDTMSDYLAGVWCKNGCAPDCRSIYYDILFGDKDIVVFKLPPGTYHWTAETTIKPFPSALENTPGVSAEFYHYFDTVHTTQGTVTVTSTDQCVVQGIVF